MDNLSASMIKLFIEYAPYIAVYFFTDALKKAFGIKGRWVWLIAFGVGIFLAAMQLIGLGIKLAPAIFISKTIQNGFALGAVSLAIRKMITEKSKKETK